MKEEEAKKELIMDNDELLKHIEGEGKSKKQKKQKNKIEDP
jgi:hypothetical protein